MQRLVSRRRRFLPSDFGTDTVWWPRSRIALLSGHGERWLLKKKKKKNWKKRWKKYFKKKCKRKETVRVVEGRRKEKIRRLFVAGRPGAKLRNARMSVRLLHKAFSEQLPLPPRRNSFESRLGATEKRAFRLTLSLLYDT